MATWALGFLSSLLSRGNDRESRPPPSPRLTYTLDLVLDTLPILIDVVQQLGRRFHTRDPRFELTVRIETAAYVLETLLAGLRDSREAEAFGTDISTLAGWLEKLLANNVAEPTEFEEQQPCPRLSVIRRCCKEPQRSGLASRALLSDLSRFSIVDWRKFSEALAQLTIRLQDQDHDFVHDQVLPRAVPNRPPMPDWDFKELVTDALAAMACNCQVEPARDMRFRLGTYKKPKGSGRTRPVTVLTKGRSAEGWIEMRLHSACEFEFQAQVARVHFSFTGQDPPDIPAKHRLRNGECVCHCLEHHRTHIRPHFWRLNLELENHRLARFWHDRQSHLPESLRYQVTLRTLLSPQGPEMRLMDAMTLSVLLAYSLFYLFAEPSVEGRWNRDNIVFYGDGNLIPLRPFLRVSNQRPSGIPFDDRTYIRYPEFLELAVMLLEIHFRESLEDILELDSAIETADESFAAASEVYQTKRIPASQPGLRQAIKSCLSLAASGEFYQDGNEEPDNEVLRAALFESVVHPLERDLKAAFEGLISTESLDEEASRKILLPYVPPNSDMRRSTSLETSNPQTVAARDHGPPNTHEPGTPAGTSRSLRGGPSRGPDSEFTLFNMDTRATDSSQTGCAWTDGWIRKFRSIVDTHISTTSQRLKVAVLDTGIDINHPDFDDERRLKERRAWLHTAPDVDMSGHGTHIISTILGLTQNADVYVAKISDGNRIDTTDHIAEAIRVATEQWDVDAISLSFGLPRRIRHIKDEIDNALHAGKIVFAAASNDGGNAARTFPGNQDGVICIHSADGLGNASLFNPTALNNTNNFCVVGENINAAWPSDSPDQLGGTKRMSGTSFAVPVAVAIAALMIGFVSHSMPEHVNWSIPLKSPEGTKAIFRSISKRRNGNHDLVNPVMAFGSGTEAELQRILRDIQTRLA